MARKDNSKKMADDIRVIDLDSKPLCHDPIASPDYIICICHKGRFEADYDFQHVSFANHQIAVVYPGHILVPTEISPDYEATLIKVTALVFYGMLNHFIDRDYFRFETEPAFPLTNKQHDNLMRLIDALRALDEVDCSTRREMKTMMTEIIIENIYHYHTLANPNHQISPHSMLSKRFFQAVIDNCYRHHDVAYYADLFHLSAKYFSHVIRRETGQNALYWIHFYLAAKAKQVLYLQSELPLKNISDQLGFPDLPSFSRFFKKVIGITPSEWRENLCTDK